MPAKTTLAMFFVASGLSADNLEQAQRKELETQVKAITSDAKALVKEGKLAEARIKYAESQALIEVKEATEAIKHLDEDIRKRVQDVLSKSGKVYETRKYQEAAVMLDDGMKLRAFQSVLAYNLALCYFQLGDRSRAMEYMVKARAGTVEPKQKQRLLELLTVFTTGENGLSLNESEKGRIAKVNQLTESIGFETSLEEAGEAEQAFFESGTPPQNKASHKSNLCSALGELKGAVASTPSATFNQANCAETNGRTAEAVRLLEKYVEMAPKALDAGESHTRIADLKALLTLPGPDGVEIRRLYATAYGSLAERKYDRAQAAFAKASDLAPEFPLTRWNLALLCEAMGRVDQAKENFTRYQQLSSDQIAKDEAGLHLGTLDAKRAKYDDEVDDAEDIVADLFNRALKLSFNGSDKRSAVRAKRAQARKNEQNKAKNRVGGFAIPYAYAQQQLGRASEHLEVALALFPLGAEANQLMGLVFLQANDGRAATKGYDVVASQGLPVAFYAEMRGRKQDEAVKVELNRDGLRLIYLSSYDKNGKPGPPKKPAGDDGLGDMVIDPATPRVQDFDARSVPLSEIKKIETDKGLIKLKLAKEELWLSPIYLPTFTPIDGPPARRFANNYTRLFVRYPGLEDSKLGTEGMSGGEKFAMGYKIATAGADIAMSGFSPMSAFSSLEDVISITRTIRGAMVSLSVSFATWEKTVDDQQQLLAGKAFKSIPTQPANLAFFQDTR
jgi:tetratricopeptide (TPR) repeat protein